MDNENKISDELIARYIDGNISEKEKLFVQNYFNEHPEELDLLIDAESALAFDKISESKKESVYARSLLDTDSLSDDVRYQLPRHGKKMIAAQQSDNNPTCAIMAQQMVLKDYGISVSQIKLLDIAKQHGWFIDKMGTPLDYVGELLNHFDVQAVQFRNANIYHLIHELSQGHRIIVGIDVNALTQDDRWRTFDDVMCGKEANHVLVVGGIDTTDPDNLQVVLSDPTNPERNKKYSAEQFMKVWEESGYFMVSTTQPVPQTYNRQMCNFDYQSGHVQQFADITYNEIVKHLEEYLEEKEKKSKKHLFLYAFLIFALIVAAAVFFSWSYFAPINVRVSVTENPANAIPDMPFDEGNLTLSYAGISPVSTLLGSKQSSFILDNISFKNRKKPLHIQFSAIGFIPVDTMVIMQESVTIQVSRNNDLATIFGYVRDEQGNPVPDATLTVQDIQTTSNDIGYFRLQIPPVKQKKSQSLQAIKTGYRPWIHHNSLPSPTEPCYIILNKN